MTKIVQITDCHLFADTSTLIKDINTYESLRAVLSDIKNKHSDADVLFVTGDLSQDETIESYAVLKQLLDEHGTPYYWILGNHDITAAELKLEFPDIPLSPFNIERDAWNLIYLNSKLDGEVKGALGDEQLAWLSKQLSENQNNTLLFLHHPITDTNSEAMNEHMLVEQEALNALIKQHAHIKAIFHGHLHHEMQSKVHQADVYCCPSTGYQYRLDFSIDDKAPGYRIIELRENTFTTQVIRL